jgi:hypothetical protein
MFATICVAAAAALSELVEAAVWEPDAEAKPVCATSSLDEVADELAVVEAAEILVVEEL